MHALLALIGSAVALAAPQPTSGRCAGAWNTGGPVTVKAVLRARHVRQATAERITVTQLVDVIGAPPPPTTPPPRSGCLVSFVLSPHRSLTLFGTWSRGSVVGWSRPAYRTSSQRLGSGNACVASDGTIHRVGRFDAASRC